MAIRMGKTRFNRASERVVAVVGLLADAGVPDAIELVDRRGGKNNLQAHAAHLTPLAVAFLLRHPRNVGLIAQGIRLRGALSGRERVWGKVREAFVQFVQASSGERVSREIRTRRPLTIGEVAHTYLPEGWGGSHTTGGAGASTLKRALKIAAHALATVGHRG